MKRPTSHLTKQLAAIMIIASMVISVFALTVSAKAPALALKNVTFSFVEGTASPFGCPPENVLDGNTATKWCHGEADSYVTIKASEPVSIIGYKLVTADDNATAANRNPEDWTLYGSSDGSSWTPVDVRTGDMTMKDVNFTPYFFMLAGASARYQYFRLNITKIRGGNNCLQLSEIAMLVDETDAYVLSADASSAADQTWGSLSNLFDNNVDTKWCGQFGGTATVVVDAQKQTGVRGYTLVTGDDTAPSGDRNPLSWTVYGSNDKVNRKQIAKVSNDTVLQATNKTAYDFAFDAVADYRYYIFEITAIHNGGCIQLSELSLIYDMSGVDRGTPNRKSDKYTYKSADLKVTANGSPDEAPYLVFNNGSIYGDNQFRFADDARHIIYGFDISKAVEPSFIVNVAGNYLVEVAPTRFGPWTAVADSTKASAGTENADIPVNPYDHEIYNRLYIRIGDADKTQQGGGGQIFSISASWSTAVGGSPQTGSASAAVAAVSLISLAGAVTAAGKKKIR